MHDHAGRDLAARVAADAIRHHEEASPGQQGEAVLIVPPHQADVRAAGRMQPKGAALAPPGDNLAPSGALRLQTGIREI